MVMKDKTDRASVKRRLQARPGLTRLMDLRKGSEKQEGTTRDGKKYLGYGTDLEWFRACNGSEQVLEKFRRIYGDTPGNSRDNPIRFTVINPDIERTFPAYYYHYQGSMQAIVCNGEEIEAERLCSTKGEAWIDQAGGVYSKNGPGVRTTKFETFKPGKRPPCRKPKCAKTIKNGHVVYIPCVGSAMLLMRVIGLHVDGLVRLHIGAEHEFFSIPEQLEEATAWGEVHNLQLHELPLMLWREEKKITMPDPKDPTKRKPVTKSLVQIAVDTELMIRSMQARRQYALQSAGTVGGQAALPPVSGYRIEPGTMISNEFGALPPDGEFRKTEAWQNVKFSFDSAATEAEANEAAAIAQAKISKGTLSPNARGQIAILRGRALQRIGETFMQNRPVDAAAGNEFIEGEVMDSQPVMSQERAKVICDLSGCLEPVLAAIAKRVGLDPDQMDQWDEGDVQRCRNRAYAASKHLSTTFSSPDDAEAAMKSFGKTQGYRDCPPDDDAAVWHAWVAFAKTSTTAATAAPAAPAKPVKKRGQ